MIQKVKVKELRIGDFYINIERGICQYMGLDYVSGKEYHLFHFANRRCCYASDESIEKKYYFCASSNKNVKLSNFNNKKSWQKKRDKMFNGEFNNIEKRIARLEVELEACDIVEKCIPKFYEDSESSKDIKKVFYNYFDRYVKQTLLQLEYHIGLYNYLLRDNYLYNSVKKHLTGLSITISLSDKFVHKLYEIDKMVKFMQDILSTSSECARIFTYIQIFNTSLEYYSSKFDSLYGQEFKDIKNLSLKDSILRYIQMHTIGTSMETQNMFVYYLIKNDKFGNDFEKGFIYCRDKFIEICNDYDYTNFINILSQANTINEEKYSIDDIDLMTGYEFENFVAKLFDKMGYKTTITQKSRDQGVDVIAEKNRQVFGIQAKCYSGNVSNSSIQEVVAGLSFYKCNKGIVVTNSYFTNSAIELATANNVILWDRNMLKQKIEDINIMKLT